MSYVERENVTIFDGGWYFACGKAKKGSCVYGGGQPVSESVEFIP